MVGKYMRIYFPYSNQPITLNQLSKHQLAFDPNGLIIELFHQIHPVSAHHLDGVQGQVRVSDWFEVKLLLNVSTTPLHPHPAGHE